MVLIGLLGRKRVGKDTLANILINKYGFHQLVLADPLKEACRALFDFNDEQLYGDLKETVDKNWGITPRKAFQYLGTDIIRNKFHELIPDIQDNFWIRRMIVRYKKLQQIYGEDVDVVVSDLRFHNEINEIYKHNGIVIKIERNNKIEDDHISEKTIDSINTYDYLIKNDSSLDEYILKATQVINNILV
jgi:hypothetical protein